MNSRLKSQKGSSASTTSNVHGSMTYSNPDLNTSGSNATYVSYINGLDEGDSQPPPSTQPNLSWHKQVMMINVISDSEPDEEVGLQCQVETTSNAVPPSSSTSLSVPPPSKCAQTSTSQHQGSGTNKKYIDTNLPNGVTNNNMWQHIFISTVACLASTYKNAWSISNNSLQAMLQKIWDIVYKNSIPHTIIIGGPVYYIVSHSTFD
ncbi:hypothetical protein J3R82DRAFT_10769 [Butyriboletus roseoflavus]|nr:hypothetical protein J3R82DRAFT_10769 [Butyriboletus roseoflavus]